MNNMVSLHCMQCMYRYVLYVCNVGYVLNVSLRETRPLRTFDFGKKVIKVCKCNGKVTFTIPFQDIYPFIKGDLAQHQERSCNIYSCLYLSKNIHSSSV